VFSEPPKGVEDVVRGVVLRYGRLGARPAFFVQARREFSPLRKALMKNRFNLEDDMLVLERTGEVGDQRSEIECRVIGPGDIGKWARAYLEAFYGETSLVSEVLKSLRRALSKGGTSLLLAVHGGQEAGTLALHRTGHHYGIYSVGTVPRMRKMGVAGSLLAKAVELADGRDSTISLQTFRSDGVESFYTKRGFTRAYVKAVYVKRDVGEK
jgi:GNAT superfamily N-acetyltransferase